MATPQSTPPTQPAGTTTPGTRWTHLHLWQIQPVRDALILVILVGLVWAGYKLSIVTVPMLLALLLAYLVEPLIVKLTSQMRMRRPVAVIMTIVVSTLLVVVPATLALTYGIAQGVKLGQVQVGNVETMLRSVGEPKNDQYRAALPSDRWRTLRDWLVEQEARAKLREAVEGVKRGATDSLPGMSRKDAPQSAAGDGQGPALPESTPPPQANEPPPLLAKPQDTEIAKAEAQGLRGAVAEVVSQGIDSLRSNAGALSAKAVQAGADAFTVAAGVLTSLGKLAFVAFLTGIFFFFFSVGFASVRRFFRDLVPVHRRERVYALADRMDRVIAGFVRGRLTICACQIVLFTLLYWLIGVPAPFIVGPLVGVLTLAPYASSLGMPVAMALMFLSPTAHGDFRDNWWWILAAPIGVQIISQILDDYILSPTIQGKNTDMSMPLILFASIAGGVLGGFYGLLLAIPIAACGKILVAELVLPRLHAWSKGTTQDILPIDR